MARFEFGCTMRKMVLTGALVLFGQGTTAQVVTALAVCIMWFALIANTKPFGEDVDDRLAQVEALQVLFTLLMGLVLQLQAATADGAQADDEALGAVLIALNCIVVALALVQQPIVRTVADRACIRPCRRCNTRGADAGSGAQRRDGEASPAAQAEGTPSHLNPLRHAGLWAAASGARDGAQLGKHGAAQFGGSNPMRRTDTLTVAPRRAAGVPDRAADAAGATALLGSSTPLSGGGSETENETRFRQGRTERRATRAKRRVQSKEEADRASSANETSVVGVPDRAADAAAAAAPLGPRSSTPLSGGGSETEETGSEY